MFIISLFIILTLVACGGGSKQSGADGSREDASGALGIGDSAEVDGVTFTLLSAKNTRDRNKFVSVEPKMVVKIEYELENGTDEEMLFGSELDVYDGTGNKMESYPLENSFGSLEPGEKIQRQIHYGIEEGPIEIHFNLGTSSNQPAIFKGKIK